MNMKDKLKGILIGFAASIGAYATNLLNLLDLGVDCFSLSCDSIRQIIYDYCILDTVVILFSLTP